MTEFGRLWGDAAITSLGFFWKAGWAFVLGYAVSAMIQAFVPKGRLTPYLGDSGLRSVSLATAFGSASSSCSFAALSAARALVQKGANFVAAVAFMFASTNLVIELGILIVIFLGWEFLAAEVIGGLLLIAISSLLIRWTCPAAWFDQARARVEQRGGEEEDDFDWRARIRSREGWNRVGHHFVSEWQMVWKEILIGFTIAGLVAVLVPPAAWEALFMAGNPLGLPHWLVVLENALIAPLVAAATFIGSMGNIPLATVLNANGVMFAGVMAFIYSDLMVPPLVVINGRYYGWRVALYIAGIMWVSIVATALIIHYGFGALGITPESGRQVEDVVRFGIDYTLYLNVAFVVVAALLVWRARHHGHSGMDHEMPGDSRIKTVAAGVAAGVLVIGLALAIATGGAG
ncbi:MAG: permease [Xanthomonadales bacterium]